MFQILVDVKKYFESQPSLIDVNVPDNKVSIFFFFVTDDDALGPCYNHVTIVMTTVKVTSQFGASL
jgi:hypothetical protein